MIVMFEFCLAVLTITRASFLSIAPTPFSTPIADTVKPAPPPVCSVPPLYVKVAIVTDKPVRHLCTV